MGNVKIVNSESVKVQNCALEYYLTHGAQTRCITEKDYVVVNKKSNALLAFVLLATEV